jgi:hypothetical protein
VGSRVGVEERLDDTPGLLDGLLAVRRYGFVFSVLA